MNFLFWRSKTRKAGSLKNPVPSKESTKDLNTLIGEYRMERFLLSLLGQSYAGEGKGIPDYSFQRIREIEGQIIELLSDSFQKDVFAILARHEFDICEFIEKENWREPLREVCRDICHFLYYGSPYPTKSEWPPLPFPGNEFFFWLLTRAKSGDDKKTGLENILTAFTERTKNGDILGYKLSNGEGENIFSRLIVVFMGEWAKQSALLINILCELERGEQFVKELLNIKE